MTKIYIPIRPNRSTADTEEKEEEEESAKLKIFEVRFFTTLILSSVTVIPRGIIQWTDFQDC